LPVAVIVMVAPSPAEATARALDVGESVPGVEVELRRLAESCGRAEQQDKHRWLFTDGTSR
jgi:hypothetical protein